MRSRGVEEAELRRLLPFASLDANELTTIARATAIVDLARGQQLFQVGDRALHFYCLRHGQVKLTRSAPDGGEKVISVVQPGQTFAEAALFMDAPSGFPVSAAAIEDSTVLAFPGDVIKDILRKSPDTCFRVLAVMSARLRELVVQIDELTLHNATYRLASYLLGQLPAGALHTRDIQLMTPKAVIASRLSIQPETFSRTLARLREAGLVETEGVHIVVCDVDGLRGILDA